MKKPKRQIKKLVEAKDDWYPCIDGKFVEVYFTPVNGRLSVWGDDDFGMEMPEDGATHKQFEQLCSKPITKARCKKMGMIMA